MTCEKRRKQRYYYLKIRSGDTVRSLYLGRGRRAQNAVARLKAVRRRRRAQRRAFEAETLGMDRLLRDLARATDLLVREAYLALGFHQHRGQWRKKRRAKTAPR